jgi:inorganic pyrophosphatase
MIFKRDISTIKTAAKYTLAYKQYLKSPKGEIRSWFHDLPLDFNKTAATVNMVVEIPRYEHGKFEISKSEPYNPIVQDTKNGKLRYINNIFPYHGYPCNYGAIPQTWEDPTHGYGIDGKDYYGDNDPLDVCEIGSSTGVAKVGDVKKVKVLGCLAMIDDGELDWKLLAIDVEDKLAREVNDIGDVEKKYPHLLGNLRRWFKNYKLPMGKGENEFGYNGKWLAKKDAVDVVETCHNSWKQLMAGKINGENLPVIFSATSEQEAQEFVLPESYEGPDANIPDEANVIYYYKD